MEQVVGKCARCYKYFYLLRHEHEMLPSVYSVADLQRSSSVEEILLDRKIYANESAARLRQLTAPAA
ncbi:unnamed protein product [Arctia plantaginis]|nr:unnamed protein product [Arctia plantaginis]